jgi:hypothetical protein
MEEPSLFEKEGEPPPHLDNSHRVPSNSTITGVVLYPKPRVGKEVPLPIGRLFGEEEGGRRETGDIPHIGNNRLITKGVP